MEARKIAMWFLEKNPSLREGKNDENTKLNKLLYFSNLMYYSVYDKNLIDEMFKKWDNGPVISSIYADYRYNGLDKLKTFDISGIDEETKKILNIINLIYSSKNSKELSDETHTHSIWKKENRNANINFEDIELKEKKLMNNLFLIYENLDFDLLEKEVINGNIYYYNKNDLEIDEDLIKDLSNITYVADPVFIEKIDGELVFS